MLKQKKCSLCESLNVVILYVSQNKFFNKIYYHCEECDLVFLPTTFHLNLTEQKERYLEHNNDINNLNLNDQQINNKENNLKEKCPRCINDTLVTDHESGEIFCSRCGFEINNISGKNVPIDNISDENKKEWA